MAVGLSAGEHPSLVNITKQVQTASLERKVCRWRDFFGAELLGTSLRRIVFLSLSFLLCAIIGVKGVARFSSSYSIYLEYTEALSIHCTDRFDMSSNS